jgi:hypothetical protein
VVTAAVTWGLLVAWLIHDLEEWATIPAWSRLTAERLVRRYPRFPGRILSVLRTTRLEATISIALVGVLIAAAAWVGASDAGRSGFFQVVLLAFGLHAVVHAAQSVLARGYTPGVITALIVVAPYSWWAWHRLDRAGVASSGGPASWALAIAAFPVAVIAARLLALAVGRRVAPRGGPVHDD